MFESFGVKGIFVSIFIEVVFNNGYFVENYEGIFVVMKDFKDVVIIEILLVVLFEIIFDGLVILNEYFVVLFESVFFYVELFFVV